MNYQDRDKSEKFQYDVIDLAKSTGLTPHDGLICLCLLTEAAKRLYERATAEGK
jgi:hypothetical protein